MKAGHQIPANSTAARVVSKGTHYVRQFKEGNEIESDNPIATSPVPPRRYNLTGHKCGRLTVIGYHSSKDGARWVCRCVCGCYLIRRSKALLNIANASVDGCRSCRNLDFLKRRQQCIESGEYKSESK